MEMTAASTDSSYKAATSFLTTMRRDRRRAQVRDPPGQLEGARANADREVLVEGRPKGDELEVVSVAEQALGGLVKVLGDVVECLGGAVFGVAQLLCRGADRERLSADDRGWPTFKELAGPATDEDRSGEDTW